MYSRKHNNNNGSCYNNNNNNSNYRRCCDINKDNAHDELRSVLNFIRNKNGGGGCNDYGQHQQQIQYQQRRQDQQQIVIETQLLMDQIDACFNALNAFFKIYGQTKNNSNNKKLINYNALLASQLSIFGSMCSDQNKKGNKRSLDLCSIKLEKYYKTLNNEQKNVLSSFINYINAAVKNKKVPILPSIGLINNNGNNGNDNKWNEESANNFMSSYLGSGHVIDDRVEKYKKNYQDMDNKYNKEWKKNGKNGVYIGKATIPDAQSIYKHCGNNIKFNKKQNKDMMNVSAMNKIYDDNDDSDDE